MMILEYIRYKLILIGAILLPPQFDSSSVFLIDPSNPIEYLARKFITWDSVYYVSVAHRGIEYEHEYAFSPIWAKLIETMSPWNTLTSLALTGVLISLTCSAIAGALISKSGFVAGLNSTGQKTAQSLYILSPAGAFLIAGYPESTFACLSMAGVWLFYRRSYTLSGFVFGLTCLLRSNGLLWGILFLYKIAQDKRSRVSIFFGGALIGMLFLVPQVRLYNDLCPGAEWCSNKIPLGYSYIQSKYWNLGFLQYWTPNNIPNFLFALPTLVLLVRSLQVLPMELKLVQIGYILGSLLFWHVQIITRVASCLPGPYWYLAKYDTRETRLWKAYFIVWGVTQAVLFGAFMPPA